MNIKELYQNLEIYTFTCKYDYTVHDNVYTFYIDKIKIVKTIYDNYKPRLKSTNQYNIDFVVDLFEDSNFEIKELYVENEWKTDTATMLIKVNNKLKSIIRKNKIENLIK